MKIIDYTVVSKTSEDELSRKVIKLIKEGWQPFYGIAQSQIDSSTCLYSQAMVKYANEQPIDKTNWVEECGEIIERRKEMKDCLGPFCETL